MMRGSLAEKLRVLRAQRGLSLTEAAKNAGIQRQTLAFLERGERHPHTPTLTKLARAYGVPVEELLEVEEPVAAGKAEAPEETGRPALEVELTNLWKSLAKRASTLKQRYRQGITYEGLLEDLARLSEDHQYLEGLRKAREGAPRAYHMEPDELADAIDAVLAEENAIWAMLEQDLDAPESVKQEARRFARRFRQAV